MRELLVGNTIIGEYDAWNLTWAEYFVPDGTTKLLLRFEGQDDDDMEATGKHYPNNKGQYCTEDPQQNVYCNNLLSRGWQLPTGISGWRKKEPFTTKSWRATRSMRSGRFSMIVLRKQGIVVTENSGRLNRPVWPVQPV